MKTVSPNTQAILLLTAPLLTGQGAATPELLTPSEYKRLARHLRELQCQPADLISADAAKVLRACQPVVEEARLQRLLERGFLLSQAIEHWQTRAIWVVSRADADYPRRLKTRLRENTPAILYGCGDIHLLENGGLAVEGSRRVDETLINYTISIGQLAARAGRAIVSGGAKGIDQAAMRGAWEAGGNVCGVLADSLEKAVLLREHRNLLLKGQLVLISPYDPNAGFNVGHAMQRNKLIYALADAALVVNSDVGKGGTWTGAVEQLDKLKLVPIYIRSTGEQSAGLAALQSKGALPWPNPHDADSFASVLKTLPAQTTLPIQMGFKLATGDIAHNNGESAAASATSQTGQTTTAVNHDSVPEALSAEKNNQIVQQAIEMPPAETLFEAVRVSVQQLLQSPMKEAEIAAGLQVSLTQTRTWLKRLVSEGVLEKKKSPVRYSVKQKCLIE